MRTSPCEIVLCWSCGVELHIQHRREDRRPEVDGENTCCGSLRVCRPCWTSIKRFDVNRVGGEIRRHLRALG